MLYLEKVFFHQLDNFLSNVFIQSGFLKVACMQKIKICHRAKYRDTKMFAAGFVSDSRDYRLMLLITFFFVFPKIYISQTSECRI